MRGWIWRAAGLGLALAILVLPATAPASESEVVQEILGILRDRGIVDEGEYNRLAARYADSQQKDGWLDRLQLSGDFRARHESFWFDRDELGSERDNRYRGRYRIRLAGQFDVNDWSAVHLRLATGEDDSRSTNQSFGNNEADFDPDGIFIDRAYVALRAPESWIAGERGSASLALGKQGNPFTWKVGKDFMLWDGDINPEGVALGLTATPGENLILFLNTGYFLLDEASSGKDPHLFGAQLGGELALNDVVQVGARGTYYQFGSLNEDFLCRGFDGDNCDGSDGATSAGGNVLSDAGVSGLLGNATGKGGMDVVEGGVYLRWSGSEWFPITVYGNWAQNLDAKSVSGTFGAVAGGADPEDTAWGAGLEIGDKKKWALLGVGYWEIEANAFPSQLIDSDLFDGLTNRKGWAFYASRQLFANTELNLTLFRSDEIEDDLVAQAESVSDAERLRLQTDLVFKF